MAILKLSKGRYKDYTFIADAKLPATYTIPGITYEAQLAVNAPFHVNDERRTELYRALLAAPGTDHVPCPVVIKLTRKDFDGLKHEATTYIGPLAHLQGVVVPRFYGIFAVDDIACIVMQDVGKPKDVDEIYMLPFYQRKAIVQAVLTIHLAGVRPVQESDMRDPRDYLFHADGSVFVVDFAECVVNHDCGYADDPKISVNCENPREYRCVQIKQLCDEIDMWTNPVILLYGRRVRLIDGPDVDDVLSATKEHWEGMVSEAEARKKVTGLLDVFYDEESRKEEFYGPPDGYDEKQIIEPIPIESSGATGTGTVNS